MSTLTKYDALFLPYVGLIIAEDEAGVLTVAGADCDWSDTFTNLWRNGPQGHNAEEIIPDGEGSRATGRAAELGDFACSILDVILAKDKSGAAALRFIADQIDRGKPPEEMDDRTYLEQYGGLAANVASILNDREIGKTQEELDAIIRTNLDAVYDIVGRDIDQIEDMIVSGEWTA